MDATSKHNDNPDTDNAAKELHHGNRQKKLQQIHGPTPEAPHSEDTPQVLAKENPAPLQQSP
jgi:hypothetical protein